MDPAIVQAPFIMTGWRSLVKIFRHACGNELGISNLSVSVGLHKLEERNHPSLIMIHSFPSHYTRGKSLNSNKRIYIRADGPPTEPNHLISALRRRRCNTVSNS